MFFRRFLLVFLLSPAVIFAQNKDSVRMCTKPSQKLKYVIAAESLSATVSLAGLYQVWYKDYPQSSFHFFNDNDEWLQMDKAGHFFSSYHTGLGAYKLFRWAGMERKKSLWYGGSMGLAYLTVVEIMDGFSQQWGASWGDVTANFAGAVFFTAQELIFEKQILLPKYSFHGTDYAEYRPELLGQKWYEQLIKDYNGQTYWLSVPFSLQEKDNTIFPKWICWSVGYSASGMIGANDNPLVINDKYLPDFDRYRQFYFSLDIDLARIESDSKVFNFLSNGFRFIKVPFPTVEYNRKEKFTFHYLYF